jgi:electron transport complex protein RnfG
MNATNPVDTGTPENSAKMLRAMVGIGLMCALMIVLTFEGTKPRIARLRAEALEQAVFKVLPGITTMQPYELTGDNTFSAADGETEGPVVYAGYDEKGEFAGVAIEASGQGYADIIRILYGYHPEEQAVVGFYVLESKETPGLGDKIEKDQNFLANFEALDVSLAENGESLLNVVEPVKSGEKDDPWEVDCITGATISSRAIGDMLGESTQRWIPLIYQNRETFVKKNENAQ